MLRALAFIASLFAIALCTPSAWAHAAPHSTVLLDIRANDVSAQLRLPIPELEAALARPLHSKEDAEGSIVNEERQAIRDLVARDLHAVSPDGASWRVDVGDLTYTRDDQVPVAVVMATLTPPTRHTIQTFDLVDSVISNQVRNHVAWVGIRTDFANGLVSGPPTFGGVTHYLRHTVRIEREGGGAARGFRAVFRLGAVHIAEGTDHLLFLLVLLLPAPLLLARSARGGRRWGAHGDTRTSANTLLRVVTAFTFGHSMTLLIGALGWLRLPSAPVETLIAISILVSAVHAIRPIFPGREAWLAGAFGLVHGLALAGALAELHLESARLALALFAFNLGIEAMQLVVVAAVFPWLMLLAKTRVYPSFRIFGALFAAVAALGWIAERAFSVVNPIGGWVNLIAAHPLGLLSGLATIALAARIHAGPTYGAIRPTTNDCVPETVEPLV